MQSCDAIAFQGTSAGVFKMTAAFMHFRSQTSLPLIDIIHPTYKATTRAGGSLSGWLSNIRNPSTECHRNEFPTAAGLS